MALKQADEELTALQLRIAQERDELRLPAELDWVHNNAS